MDCKSSSLMPILHAKEPTSPQMSNKIHEAKLSKSGASAGDRIDLFQITVMSFGYKRGAPPEANIVFDVRFLKNPYWVEELRPLSGLDLPVQQYVLSQDAAKDFLESVVKLLTCVVPEIAALKTRDFIIAFGCTGGQHRSATLAEALKSELNRLFPQYPVRIRHRELSHKTDSSGKDDSAAEE